MDVRGVIAQSTLVKGLSDQEIDQIAAIAEVKKYEGGQALVRQFEKTRHMMIVLDGAARINTYSGNSIAHLGPGSVIGEIAILDDEPRSATVISDRGTTVAVISAQKLREVMDSNPHIELVLLRNLSKGLCAHIRMTNLKLEELFGRM
ncbi:MAG TPA: cyclic nucleotide-binding domain-containing protein [Chthonomonadales bacterium]|nr:cyclic nucleotide-binding domain-containing protein [Chthonomonadales bacterium]